MAMYYRFIGYSHISTGVVFPSHALREVQYTRPLYIVYDTLNVSLLKLYQYTEDVNDKLALAL